MYFYLLYVFAMCYCDAFLLCVFAISFAMCICYVFCHMLLLCAFLYVVAMRFCYMHFLYVAAVRICFVFVFQQIHTLSTCKDRYLFRIKHRNEYDHTKIIDINHRASSKIHPTAPIEEKSSKSSKLL